jgi:hypothetical protein
VSLPRKRAGRVIHMRPSCRCCRRISSESCHSGGDDDGRLFRYVRIWRASAVLPKTCACDGRVGMMSVTVASAPAMKFQRYCRPQLLRPSG